MFIRHCMLLVLSLTWTSTWADVTNVKEFFDVLKKYPSRNFSLGFVSKANVDVVKRYFSHNTQFLLFNGTESMLDALRNEKIIGKQRSNGNSIDSVDHY
jgi:hypothetical protein